MKTLMFVLTFWGFVLMSSAIFGCKLSFSKGKFEFTWGLYYYYLRKYEEKKNED